MTASVAGDRYEGLAEQEPEGEPDERVAAFHRELTDRYPELHTLPDEDDSSPWSDDLALSASGVLMSICFSRAEEVASYVIALAAAHGLVCYDPQEDVVYNPSG